MAEYLSTIEEMRKALINAYGKIPKGSLEVHKWLISRAGVNDSDLEYEERYRRHERICKVLGFSIKGGIAGRDINEY